MPIVDVILSVRAEELRAWVRGNVLPSRCLWRCSSSGCWSLKFGWGRCGCEVYPAEDL